MCLLSAVIEGDFQQGQQFGINDKQDSVRLQWCVLDPITWPALLFLHYFRLLPRLDLSQNKCASNLVFCPAPLSSYFSLFSFHVP